MNDRPISFVTEMVRAIREDRKTKTRRILSIQPPDWAVEPMPAVGPFVTFHGVHPKGKCGHSKCACINEETGGLSMWTIKSPKGGAGDRLWVQETWNAWDKWEHLKPTEIPRGVEIFYAADFGPHIDEHKPWRPSRFMCKWMARERLEIVSVRVERVQAASYEDIQAEGWPGPRSFPGHADEDEINRDAARDWWEDLWISLHGLESWRANPFVWVYEFKRL